MRLIILMFLMGFPFTTGTAQRAAPSSSEEASGITNLRFATILVGDYDEALKWYTEVLGFEKLQDQKFGVGHRWIVVAPKGQKGVGIVLAVPRPVGPGDNTKDYRDRIGKVTNWVFQAKDVRLLHKELSRRGVKFIEPPTNQPWGTVQAIFADPYGNIFVVESPRPRNQPVNPKPAQPIGGPVMQPMGTEK